MLVPLPPLVLALVLALFPVRVQVQVVVLGTLILSGVPVWMCRQAQMCARLRAIHVDLKTQRKQQRGTLKRLH